MNTGFHFKEYSEWTKKVGIAKEDFRLWLKQFLLTEAQRVVAKGKRRTPVDTGYLRNSWYIGSQTVVQTRTASGKAKIDTKNSDVLSVKVVGNVLQVEIGLGADYASFVEFGHHSYEGRYMLTISIDEVQRQLPARFNKEFLTFIKSKGVI